MARTNRTGSGSHPGTGTPQLTPADATVLAARYVISAGVAITSIVMSYQALAELSAAGHIAPQWQWVWPVIVVAPELSGALAVVAAQRRGEGAVWSWTLLVIATGASIAANVAAAPPDTLSRILHGVVPAVGVVQVKDVCNGIREWLSFAVPDVPEPVVVPELVMVPEVVPVPVPQVPVPVPVAVVPPRPTKEPAFPAAPEPGPPARSEPKPRNSKPTRNVSGKKRTAIPFADRVDTARKLLAENPELTSAALGEQFGTSREYAGRVLRAAVKPVPAAAS